jgi:hypothetical protein
VTRSPHIIKPALSAAEAAVANDLRGLLSGYPHDAVRQALDLAAFRFAPKRQRKPSIATLVKRAEKEGKTVTSVTTPDGMTLHFSAAEAMTNESDNPWDEVNAANSKRPS